MESITRAMHSKPELHYSDMNNTGRKVIEQNESTIDDLMIELLKSRKDTDVITIADYGTADGGNILPLLRKLVECVQKSKGMDQEINIVFEDHCANDFNALAKTILGKHHMEGLQTSDNVHVLVSPTSMYKQCLPSDSLDFGFCIYALHWLSVCPWQMKDQIFVQDDDSTYHPLFEAQARKDWRDFVIKRGKELRTGGMFFVSSGVKGSSDKMDYLTDLYRQMVQENIISEYELKNTNVAFFLDRTEKDYTSIFSDSCDPEEKYLGLRLVSSKLYEREYWPVEPEMYLNDDFLSRRAAAIMLQIKSWLYNTIYFGLSEERPLAERSAITEEFFERLRVKIFNDGPAFRYIHPMIDIVFQKQ